MYRSLLRRNSLIYAPLKISSSAYLCRSSFASKASKNIVEFIPQTSGENPDANSKSLKSKPADIIVETADLSLGKEKTTKSAKSKSTGKSKKTSKPETEPTLLDVNSIKVQQSPNPFDLLDKVGKSPLARPNEPQVEISAPESNESLLEADATKETFHESKVEVIESQITESSPIQNVTENVSTEKIVPASSVSPIAQETLEAVTEEQSNNIESNAVSENAEFKPETDNIPKKSEVVIEEIALVQGSEPVIAMEESDHELLQPIEPEIPRVDENSTLDAKLQSVTEDIAVAPEMDSTNAENSSEVAFSSEIIPETPILDESVESLDRISDLLNNSEAGESTIHMNTVESSVEVIAVDYSEKGHEETLELAMENHAETHTVIEQLAALQTETEPEANVCEQPKPEEPKEFTTFTLKDWESLQQNDNPDLLSTEKSTAHLNPHERANLEILQQITKEEQVPQKPAPTQRFAHYTNVNELNANERTSISIESLMKVGLHFGHTPALFHPHMLPYIYGERNGIHIINLSHTISHLRRAINVTRDISARGGKILFVGTRPSLHQIVVKAAEVGQAFFVTKWKGGTITNRERVLRRSVGFDFGKATQALQAEMKLGKGDPSDTETMAEKSKGVPEVYKPDLLIILDFPNNVYAVREAIQEHIPVIAICDTNCDPRLVQYPIPANDDEFSGVSLIARVLSRAAREGKMIRNGLIYQHKMESEQDEARY